MLCGSLDGRRVWGGMNTYIYMAESLPSSPEIITMLLIGYTLLENKTFKLKKKKEMFCGKEGWGLFSGVDRSQQ